MDFKIKYQLLSILLLACLGLKAQTSDTIIVAKLRGHGITFSNNNSITLLTNGQQKFDDLFKAIDQARSSIHMEYFNFRNDSINKELVSHLAPKVKEGVEVRLIFDGFGNYSNNQPMRRRDLKKMRELGIQIKEYNPVRFPFVNDFFNRDHRKIVIIDGKIAYTGGMNVADYYIKGTERVGSWNDMHCRIDGEEVNTLQAIFLRMWKKVSGEDISGAKYYRGLEPADYFHDLKPDVTPTKYKKLVGIINREPRRQSDIIRFFYLNAINAAKDSIKIITPYFTPNRKMRKALKEAVKRGVKVEIMLSTKSDVPLTPDVGFFNAHNLMQAGCRVWMYTPGFHHTKIITVDGRFCTVGSANMCSRSFRWDREENAVIIDKYTTKELDDIFEKDKKESFFLTEETWKKWRTPCDRHRGWWASFLSPFL